MHPSKSEDEDKACFKEWLKELLSDVTSENQTEFVYGGYKILEIKQTDNNFNIDLNFTKNTQIDDANCASDSATNLDRLIISEAQ